MYIYGQYFVENLIHILEVRSATLTTSTDNLNEKYLEERKLNCQFGNGINQSIMLRNWYVFI